MSSVPLLGCVFQQQTLSFLRVPKLSPVSATSQWRAWPKTINVNKRLLAPQGGLTPREVMNQLGIRNLIFHAACSCNVSACVSLLVPPAVQFTVCTQWGATAESVQSRSVGQAVELQGAVNRRLVSQWGVVPLAGSLTSRRYGTSNKQSSWIRAVRHGIFVVVYCLLLIWSNFPWTTLRCVLSECRSICSHILGDTLSVFVY
jgi:hypothetical protein